MLSPRVAPDPYVRDRAFTQHLSGDQVRKEPGLELISEVLLIGVRFGFGIRLRKKRRLRKKTLSLLRILSEILIEVTLSFNPYTRLNDGLWTAVLSDDVGNNHKPHIGLRFLFGVGLDDGLGKEFYRLINPLVSVVLEKPLVQIILVNRDHLHWNAENRFEPWEGWPSNDRCSRSHWRLYTLGPGLKGLDPSARSNDPCPQTV